MQTASHAWLRDRTTASGTVVLTVPQSEAVSAIKTILAYSTVTDFARFRG
jgi:hypothetical protein